MTIDRMILNSALHLEHKNDQITDRLSEQLRIEANLVA